MRYARMTAQCLVQQGFGSDRQGRAGRRSRVLHALWNSLLLEIGSGLVGAFGRGLRMTA
jgi:hypothetical protein